jgi:hypothetical protein
VRPGHPDLWLLEVDTRPPIHSQNEYFCHGEEVAPTISHVPQGVTMAPVNKKELSARMSKRLANFKLSDAVINELVDRVLIDGWIIGRFNPCIYGICIDYFTDKLPQVEDFSSKLGIATWQVFPYGIIDWDRFHIQVAFNVDELEGKVPNREFGF